MSRSRVFALLLLTATIALAQAGKYKLGRLATSAEIKAHNISVSPDGAGLPHGEGTAATGRSVYAAKCASCHGEKGEGRAGYALVAGGAGTLKTSDPVVTVGSYWPYSTTVWDYLNRAMPYQNPGSLRADEVYSVTAYILYLNKIVAENEVLNEKTLPKVKMPNREGFVPDPRPDVHTKKR